MCVCVCVCVQVQLVPKSLADGEPVGDGRNEPNRNPHLPPPRDRLDWSLAFRQPFNFIRMLIGGGIRVPRPTP